MKKTFIRKPVSILLSLLMLLSVFGGMAASVNATNYYGVETAASALRTGDLFEMGMYPQSKVTDTSLLVALSQIECEMRSYGYLKNANAATGTADTVDMQYADIVFDGELYRKVTINEKRPHFTRNSDGNNGYTTQADNGYFVGRTYYFKWEPIVWRVLATESDGVTVTSHYLLDAQAYNDYFETVTWETSSLREWLNDDFLQLAFSETEQDKIVAIEKENDDNPDLGTSGGNNTTDTIWILSLKEVVRQDYGFLYTNGEDASKVARGTEYAKSQGLWVEANGDGNWWQRTPGGASTLVCVVTSDGATRNTYDEACVTSYGVRPAFKLDLDAIVGASDHELCRLGHTPGEPVTENRVEATCTENGGYDRATYCTVCGEELGRQHETISSSGHTAGEPVIENRVEATCTENGGYDRATYCTACGDELNRAHETITASGHIEGASAIEDFVEPTCTGGGSYAVVIRCTACGEVLRRTEKTLAATGHKPGNPVVESIVEATTEQEGCFVLVTHCEECGEELSRETVATAKLPTSDEPDSGNACPWCGKTVHNTVWEDFVHSLFTFIKVMLERLQWFK